MLTWYDKNARSLPWRGTDDPYAIWVSEVMLQQTRVETVIPYYKRWMELFPTMQDLANAPEESVLKAWEGLGYYSRARNFQAAARQVLENHGGRLPDSIKDLEKLPGVGRYTAGALASLVYGKDEPALDGNIRRVLARLIDLSIPARSPQGEEILWDVARELVPTGKAGDFNQALMDLGATVCTPRNPDCSKCPLQPFCRARSLGIQEERPVKTNRSPHSSHHGGCCGHLSRSTRTCRQATGKWICWAGFGNSPAARKRSSKPSSMLCGGRSWKNSEQVSGLGKELGVFRACLYPFPGDPARLSL